MSDANYDVEGLYDDDEENCFDEELMKELWERRTEMTEMKAQIKQLTKERDELRQQVEDLKNGFEGSCYACEPVGEMNKRLQKERDEARREVCNWSVGVGLKATSQAVAEGRGWDCYKEKVK